MASESIIYTRHAQDKFTLLRKHGFEVTVQQIEDTVLAPDLVIAQSGGRLLAQKGISDRHVLRVIYRRSEQGLVIITFYPAYRKRYER